MPFADVDLRPDDVVVNDTLAMFELTGYREQIAEALFKLEPLAGVPSLDHRTAAHSSTLR